MATVEENKRCILWRWENGSVVWGVYFKPNHRQYFPYGTTKEVAEEAFKKLSKE